MGGVIGPRGFGGVSEGVALLWMEVTLVDVFLLELG